MGDPAKREGIGNGLWVMGEEMRRGRRCLLKVLGFLKLGTGNEELGTSNIDGKAVHLAGLRFRGDRPTFDFMNEWSHCPEVERHSDRMSGAWVFRGTRVPVRSLFENLEDGATVDEFLEWFPGVTRHQVEAVLEFASEGLATPAAA